MEAPDLFFLRKRQRVAASSDQGPAICARRALVEGRGCSRIVVLQQIQHFGSRIMTIAAHHDLDPRPVAPDPGDARRGTCAISSPEGLFPGRSSDSTDLPEPASKICMGWKQ